MSSRSGGLVGAQRPRHVHVPAAVSSAGEEAVELARMAGLVLDPWQEFVLAASLSERADGKWSAFEVGLVVSRQNGKGSILEARELAGLFLLGERLLIHSAHQFDTSLEAFSRLESLIADNDEFSSRVKKITRSHGEEGITLTNGQRVRFRTRTKGGGRGFSCDCLILDEAMILPTSSHGALLPTLSARPNPQVWYTGSAVDQNVHEHGEVLTSIRERGLKQDDPALAYFEWSADTDIDHVHEVAVDEQAWADANPGLGIRITSEHVAREQRSMDPRTFAVERLGVGDWPSLDGVDDSAISQAMWKACEDTESVVVNPVRFAFDVTPDRQTASIVAAGFRDDGLPHVEVVDHRAGTRWIPERLEQLQRDHDSGPIILDQRSPAAALMPALVERGLRFEVIGGGEYAQACGLFFDDVAEKRLMHLGTSELAAAVLGAKKRPLGDAWAWSRKTSTVDISPLVAATLARFAAAGDGPSVYEERGLLVI
jgi:hypothetical protein